ncbi:hypothetical protein ADK92_37215 [Streptomyces sp. XY533]|nr:hypothetical protein ADK92_37215 [Streptomyces sp. XY533]
MVAGAGDVDEPADLGGEGAGEGELVVGEGVDERGVGERDVVRSTMTGPSVAVRASVRTWTVSRSSSPRT